MRHLLLRTTINQVGRNLKSAGISDIESVAQTIYDIGNGVDKILLQHDEKKRAIEADTSYTTEGKRGRIEVLKAEARGKIAAMSPQGSLLAEQESISGMLTNETCRARGCTIHGEPLKKVEPFEALRLSMEAQELRRFLEMKQQAANAATAEKVAKVEQEGRHVSDEMRKPVNVFEEFYFKTMEFFTKEDQAAVNALERPPRGITVLSPGALAIGDELLQQAISPELFAKRAALSATGQNIDLILDAANEILEFPTRNAPVDDTSFASSSDLPMMPVSAGPPLD